MNRTDSCDVEQRVLVLAPTGRDAANSLTVLSRAGLVCTACRDVADLCHEIGVGAAVVILTEESLSLDKASFLAEALGTQPSWSDLPIVVLTRGGPESPAAERAMKTLGNVILLERPVRMFTLITTAKTALRARVKQYQIRAQLQELRQADARKDEFLATLAHELRNPLAPIRTGLQILQATGELKGPAAHSRDMMERQVTHMVRLIDDLMDVSRITRGKVQLMRERLDFRQVLENALETSRPLIEAARHEFVISLPAEPLPLDGDPTRLAQIVSNLLNNAAKYTPDGGAISLSALIDLDTMVVRVSDNGVGIPADMLSDVFEMFTQVGRSIDRAKGGLGIGLTLVRRLVEMHGGTITAESPGTGQGSTFVLRLPLAREPASCDENIPVIAGTDPVARHGLRVMVVDDNVDGAESLALMLQCFGYDTRTAYSGTRAIEIVRDFRPKVIFLDIGLPGMNGYELARRLRRDPQLTKAVLIALSGWGSEDDRRQARAAGFDFHLTKPADTDALQRLLAGVQ